MAEHNEIKLIVVTLQHWMLSNIAKWCEQKCHLKTFLLNRLLYKTFKIWTDFKLLGIIYLQNRIYKTLETETRQLTPIGQNTSTGNRAWKQYVANRLANLGETTRVM